MYMYVMNIHGVFAPRINTGVSLSVATSGRFATASRAKHTNARSLSFLSWRQSTQPYCARSIKTIVTATSEDCCGFVTFGRNNSVEDGLTFVSSPGVILCG